MATTTQSQPILTALPTASGRAGFGGTLASEFTKIRSVRSTYWTLLVLLVVSVGIGAAITGGTAASWSHMAPSDRASFDPTQASVAGLFYLGQLVIVVFGAMTLTAEYSTGMIRTSLTAMPRRTVVYAAKATIFAIVALVVTFAAAFISFFLGQLLLGSTHDVVPILAHLLPQSWYQDVDRWLPDAAGRALSVTVGPPPGHLFSAWNQFAVFAVYTAVLLVVGAVLFRKRDA